MSQTEAHLSQSAHSTFELQAELECLSLPKSASHPFIYEMSGSIFLILAVAIDGGEADHRLHLLSTRSFRLHSLNGPTTSLRKSIEECSGDVSVHEVTFYFHLLRFWGQIPGVREQEARRPLEQLLSSRQRGGEVVRVAWPCPHTTSDRR
jgi:hypothetical protein